MKKIRTITKEKLSELVAQGLVDEFEDRFIFKKTKHVVYKEFMMDELLDKEIECNELHFGYLDRDVLEYSGWLIDEDIIEEVL